MAGDAARSTSGPVRSAYEALRERITAYDPLLLLLAFGMMSLADTPDEPDGRVGRSSIAQAPGELLQALVLRRCRSEYGDRRLSQDEFDTFVDLLLRTQEEEMRLRSERIGNIAGEDEKYRVVLTNIGHSTQVVRLIGYPQHITATMIRMFAPYDALLHGRFGVRCTDLIRMLEQAVLLIQRRYLKYRTINDLRTRLGYCQEVATAIIADYPATSAQMAEIARVADAEGASDTVERMLAHAIDDLLPSVFTLTLDDLVALCPSDVEPDGIRAIVGMWSLRFGDLRDAEEDEHSFLVQNPVWDRPFIDIDMDTFLLPIPWSLFNAMREMLENLAKGDTAIRRAYEETKGNTFEVVVVDRVAEAFPDATIYRSIHYPDANDEKKTRESDILVLLDTHAIIIEAKTGRIRGDAKVGAPDDVAKATHITYLSGVEQALHFRAFLQSDRQRHVVTTAAGRHTLDLSRISHFTMLVVAWSRLGSAQSSVYTIKEPFFQTAEDLVPVMTSYELQAALEILDLQSERLHYLAKRAMIDRVTNHLSTEGEFALLGHYLETCFRLDPRRNYRREPLKLLDASRAITGYFLGKWLGLPSPQPTIACSSWWLDMLRGVERQPLPFWAQVCFALLEAPLDDQVRLARRMSHAAIEVVRVGTPGAPRFERLHVTSRLSEPYVLLAAIYRGSAGDGIRALCQAEATRIRQISGDLYIICIHIEVLADRWRWTLIESV